MKAEEIIAELKKQNEDVSEWAYGDFPKELGETQEVFSKGGEGEGEDWQRVYFFKEHNVYLKFKGFYSSYNGTDFDNGFDEHCEIVVPKEKTITVYE